MIMIAMMLVVILVLITKVLPIFNQVFEQLGTEMNAFSLSLLKFGSNINRYAVLLIVLLCILALLLVLHENHRWKGYFYPLCGRISSDKRSL